MSIFDQPPVTVAQYYNTAINDARFLNTFVRKRYQVTYDRIWNDPDFSPAEALAALGTDAAELFAAHEALGRFIAAIDPKFVALAPPKPGVTINKDGTVVLAHPPKKP